MKNEATKSEPLYSLQVVPANKFFSEKNPLCIAPKSEAEGHAVSPQVSTLAQEEKDWDQAWFASYE